MRLSGRQGELEGWNFNFVKWPDPNNPRVSPRQLVERDNLHRTETANPGKEQKFQGLPYIPVRPNRRGLRGPQCRAECTLLKDCRCDTATATAPEGQQTQPQPRPGHT